MPNTGLATLLIEIGTEELPPHHLSKLSGTFSKVLAQGLTDAGITYSKVEHFVTPRRIAARLQEVPATQPQRLVQKRGPAVANAYDASGNPTPAALGFAKSCKVSIEQLNVLESPQGSWLVFEQQEGGMPLENILPTIIEKAINEIPAKKRMRWGDNTLEFLRPIHWLTIVHGSKGLPIKIMGINATQHTHGHRVHAPEAILVNNADEYLPILRKAKVIADFEERKQIIKNTIEFLGKNNGGNTVIEPELLDEVNGLVEWPVPLSAKFNNTFLEVPQEALISSMQNHQKCFAIKNPSGKLLNTFVLVSNTEAMSPDNITIGNERVMQARLADAKFFYDQDRRHPLNSRLEDLKNMIFQKKLGTLYDKSQRISKLAGHIAKLIDASPRLCESAGKLCKADLLTEMVFEFPELQGIMGNYYARNDGEPIEVCTAIQESYLPRFAKDSLPESPTGICVALADRLDTLIGIFGIGQLPSGDKDPFGLRRQALAILRILIEKKLPLDLEELCQIARHGYGGLFDDEVVQQVLTFCFERFKAWYQEQGISPQTIEAVMANRPTEPYDCSRRILAINHFQTLPQAEYLASANKRVRNILQKSNILLNLQQLPEINQTLLKEAAEKDLFLAIDALKGQTTPLIADGQYQEALIELANLQQVVDNFFDQVMVMCEDADLRDNRIRLLGHLSAL
ncbi:MAG TPA: glycine--tRNA ligase subunit beta, partial [Candidatus Berkiella sp.]|nr:glycine--tRNA ligase subunit beta [Candidatus Berkiella sp.]